MKKTLPRELFIVAAKRTAFGTFGGALKDLSATALGVEAAKAALAQAGVKPDAIDQVVFGNVQQTSPDAIYHARHVGLRAGVPDKAPALTVNRLCGSGFQAVISGAEQILLGDAELCLVGGAENMSQAPHVVQGVRWGLPFGKSPELQDSLWAALTDSYCNAPMAITAENLADKYGISREACDELALRSQKGWAAANEAGRFKDEIAPLELAGKKGPVTFAVDEHPRPDASLESMAKLRPVFKKDGRVTAGNASGICDGAAALIVASGDAVKKHGLKPLARLVQWGVAGVDPSIMGIGPAPAIRIALDRAGLELGGIDLFEVNEAFAPQYLAVEKELGLPREKTNVNGGAIALGHPLGASGARITTHLCYELARRNGRYAVGSACIGGGQGIAVVLGAV
ncbi:MAG: acetyl-CoA C-acetyltransferase [Deltaproteobacteria bacterium]|nr:acetyl-CoA C-acetyltransferase [Deltaproteobacteria bacterium]